MAADSARKPRGRGGAGGASRNREQAKKAAREYRARINDKMARLLKMQAYRRQYRDYLRQWAQANYGLADPDVYTL